MIYLSLIGLLTGYLITRATFDETSGKRTLMLYLTIPFIALLFFNLGNLINTLLLFIIAHLIGGVFYLWKKKSH